MPRKPRENRLLLTDVELELMRSIWERGEASVSLVQLDMVRQGKETAYTTVKTMFDRLVKAAICTSKEIKSVYCHYPLKDRPAGNCHAVVQPLERKDFRQRTHSTD